MNMSNGVTGGNFTTLTDLKKSAAREGTVLSLTTAGVRTVYSVDLLDLGNSVLLDNGLFANVAESTAIATELFVSPSGSDSNSGLTVSDPFLTIQKTASFISTFSDGLWDIKLAAGTYILGADYGGGKYTSTSIKISGPDIGGHPNVPTAIVDMATDVTGDGFRSAINTQINVTDVKVINATSGNAAECNAGRISLNNFHTFNCRTAIVALSAAFVSVRGGIWDGNNIPTGTGYSTFFNVAHDMSQASNDAATDALVIKNFDRGLLLNEGVQGHLDNINVLDCLIGINIKRGAGAVNTKTMRVDGCGVGLQAENNPWFNNAIRFGEISANTINIKTLGSSPELLRRTSVREFLGNELPVISLAEHTGTTAATIVYSPDTLPLEFMGQNGHRLWGQMEINLTNTSAVDFRVSLFFGSLGLAFIDIPAGETSAIIRYDIVILDKSAADNIVSTIE